tara:strand:- start:1226 stop:1558 length:333 start_codon:yes stop_codon:yes gene_type:complete
MKETVTVYRFRDAFKQSDTYKNNFSYEGLHALFEYIEQVEDDIGEEFELDVVGICCDYTEYDSLEEFNGAMNYLSDDKIYTLDDIREETVVIEIPDYSIAKKKRFITGEF